jgi:hypothetical protein
VTVARVLAAAVVLLALPAHTRLASAQVEERPWAQGVSDAEQQRALDGFRTGNEAFGATDYVAAVRAYRDALGHWDHPAIHGNLAVALIHLDDPVAALEHLDEALRFGPSPFEPSMYGQLETDRKLLLGQLGSIEVVCDVDGAVVTLDGHTVLVGKGTIARTVRAGSYQVVAKKQSHLTFASQVSALPAHPVIIRVELVPLELAGGVERRWAPWKPWAVVSGGAALAGIGLAYQLAARGSVDEFEAEIARSCPSGCRPEDLPRPVRDLEERARLQNRIGVTALALGGVAFVAGGAMVVWNQPRRVRLEESGQRVSAAPLVGAHVLGVALGGRF